MTLREFVDDVAAERRTITVYATNPDERLERYFRTRNVSVEHEPLPDDGSPGFVVVTADGEFVGSVGVTAVRALVSPTPAEHEFPSDGPVRVPMNLLADTTFVAFDRRRLLAATREIEDRAFRRERGTLRSGFQLLSRLSSESETYETLAGDTHLDVHVYGRPDDRPDLSNATVHAEDDEEIGAFWFVVFDGGGDDRQACALLAEEVERDSDSFRGFWTYDAELVADIGDYLTATYG